jgi:hypothetical protein
MRPDKGAAAYLAFIQLSWISQLLHVNGSTSDRLVPARSDNVGTLAN